MILPAGSWVFSIQNLFSGQHIDNSAVQIKLDPDADRSSPSGWAGNSLRGAALISIPVRIEGLPQGQEVYSAGYQFAVHAGEAGEWRSGWRASSIALQGAPTQSSIGMPVDSAFYNRVKEMSVRITGFLDLSLVRHDPAGIGLFNYGRTYMPGLGMCEIRFDLASCLSPWQRAVLSKIDQKGIRSPLTSELCAPWPTTGDFSPVKRYMPTYEPINGGPFQTFGSSSYVRLSPAAHIRRYFDFKDLRLGKYFVLPVNQPATVLAQPD
jgi:hypothetical protein